MFTVSLTCSHVLAGRGASGALSLGLARSARRFAGSRPHDSRGRSSAPNAARLPALSSRPGERTSVAKTKSSGEGYLSRVAALAGPSRGEHRRRPTSALSSRREVKSVVRRFKESSHCPLRASSLSESGSHPVSAALRPPGSRPPRSCVLPSNCLTENGYLASHDHRCLVVAASTLRSSSSAKTNYSERWITRLVCR